MQEVEIRTLIGDDKDKVVDRLLKRGFKLKKDVVQHDIMFDYPDGRLFVNGCKIRLRIEGDKRELTYKGSMLGSDKISKRTELNIPLGDTSAESVGELMTALGYPMLFQVKKHRLVYTDGKSEVCFDEWPIIGCIMEVEGEEEAIGRLAQEVAPEHVFQNLRLKHYFQQKMDETHKTLDELVSEYEQKTGFVLGNLGLSLGL